jgi:hypothetical protein
LAKVSERDVAHLSEDVADVGEEHAIQFADERHAQLVVEHEQCLTAERKALGRDRADGVLLESAERRAAAGEETLRPRHRAVEAPRQSKADARCKDQPRADESGR